MDDITRAFADAYPEVNPNAIPRRTARARLLRAADQRSGVLLLDHVTKVTTAMLGFLRRLRGGVAGVLLVFDVEGERDRQRMRGRHLGVFSVQMPLASTDRLRKVLRSACAERQLSLDRDIERHLLRSARGRPGWIDQCAQLAIQPRYWRGDRLFVSVLCTDTELTLRQGDLHLVPAESERP